VCKKLLPNPESIAQSEARWLRLVFTSDGDETAQREFVARYRLERFPMVRRANSACDIGRQAPYAVLIDEEGRVRAKGLVKHSRAPQRA